MSPVLGELAVPVQPVGLDETETELNAEAFKAILSIPTGLLGLADAKIESFTFRLNVVDAPGLHVDGVSDIQPKLSAAVVDSNGMFCP